MEADAYLCQIKGELAEGEQIRSQLARMRDESAKRYTQLPPTFPIRLVTPYCAVGVLWCAVGGLKR